MYNDFWERNMPLRDFIEKYFRYTSKINPEHMNIAYTNIRCKSVSDEVRRKLGKKGLYEVGEEMICRLYLKTDEGAKFNANIRYKILCINSRGDNHRKHKRQEEIHIDRRTFKQTLQIRILCYMSFLSRGIH